MLSRMPIPKVMSRSRAKNTGRAGKGRANLGQTFRRALWLLRVVSQSNGLSASELRERLIRDGDRTTERRIRETLRKLQDSGIGVWEDQEDCTATGASRWKVQQGVRIGEVLQLNRQELMALYLSRQSLSPLRETSLYRDFESAFEKIEKFLGRPALREFKSFQEEVHFSQVSGLIMNLDKSVVDAAHAACSEGHVFEVLYFSPKRQVWEKRKLGPHFLTFSGGALYIFAEDLVEKKLKTFSLSRMKEGRMLGEEVYDASRVSYQEAFGQDLGIVRGQGGAQSIVLHFDPGGATTYVRERLWHASQELRPLPSGGVELRMNVGVTSLLVKWILGFEATVQVIEPESLRDQVASAAQSIVDRYRRKNAA